MLQTKPDAIKIQISQTRRVPETLTMWPTPGPEVDFVMDPRAPFGLKLRPQSVKALYCFGILGETAPDRVSDTIKSFYEALQPGGEFYLIEPDFDYITRAAVGGDMGAKEFSRDFTRKSYFTLQYISELLNKVGFAQEKQVIWYHTNGLKFDKHHYEVIVSGKKNDE